MIDSRFLPRSTIGANAGREYIGTIKSIYSLTEAMMLLYPGMFGIRRISKISLTCSFVVKHGVCAL